MKIVGNTLSDAFFSRLAFSSFIHKIVSVKQLEPKLMNASIQRLFLALAWPPNKSIGRPAVKSSKLRFSLWRGRQIKVLAGLLSSSSKLRFSLWRGRQIKVKRKMLLYASIQEHFSFHFCLTAYGKNVIMENALLW